jgi:hypothetical protein
MAHTVGRWAGLFALHERMLVGDPAAPNDLAHEVLDALVEHLQVSFSTTDRQALWDGIVTAFLDYAEDPAQCPAENGHDVFNFLTMVAWRRVRDVRRTSARRARWEGQYAAERHRPAGPSGEPAVELPDPLAKMVQDEDAATTAAAASSHRERVMSVLTDQQDRRVQELRFAGERHARAFAAVLGIEGLPATEQQRRVKQHKDRIDKIIERALGPGAARLGAPARRARGTRNADSGQQP